MVPLSRQAEEQTPTQRTIIGRTLKSLPLSKISLPLSKRSNVIVM